jgi:hypothetical protein
MLSVTQYLFITLLSTVMWHGRQSVYRASHVCSNVWAVVALCLSRLESAEPLRKKLDNHTLDAGIICECVLPANSPSYSKRFEPNPSRKQHP